jgi:hypothetical protein
MAVFSASEAHCFIVVLTSLGSFPDQEDTSLRGPHAACSLSLIASTLAVVPHAWTPDEIQDAQLKIPRPPTAFAIYDLGKT